MPATEPELKDCPGCGAKPSYCHKLGCDIERCHFCGLQRIGCCHRRNKETPRVLWTGEWPGMAECRQYNLWCVMGPNGWEPADADAKDVQPDLNKLIMICRWNRMTHRWEMP